ncbi:hypothetical protein [Methylobacterium sp. V23]|jgi:hypothetical protein|uniref:hypothetical protein n=1 Tax=Methylobacterium sp. V23 TaxID=2044878 RepID=UPI000CDB262F|nr:hypothetical protein [Methylobacterium sp. V23]POR42885.1 hypothetical protein CRT23_10500 [Methylobacterium sp. V23]
MSRLHNSQFVAVVAVAVLLAGCSGDLNPMRIAYGTGEAGPPAKAPDFVAQSRRGSDDFMPVGVSAPARPIRAKTPEGTKALEAELVAARGRNEARGRSAEGAAQGAKP